MKSRFRRFASIPFALLAASCGPNADTFDRTTMLSTLANDVILPTYVALADRATAFDAATAAFCASPDATTLTAAQTAWSLAMREYERAEAAPFGPYRTADFQHRLDTWPIDTVAVDGVLTSHTLATPLPASLEGLSVAEYLLFDPTAGNDAILAAFADPTNGAFRCTYLEKITADVAVQAASLRDEWSPTGTTKYGTELATAGNGSTAYTTASAAIAEVLNGLILAAIEAHDMRLGAPIGNRDSLTGDSLPHVDKTESRFSDRSKQDLLDVLDGIEAVYRGGFDGGPAQAVDGGVTKLGLRDYVRSRRGGADVDARFLAALATARSTIEAITPSIREAAALTTPAVPEPTIDAAYDAMHAVVKALSIDVASVLAVSVVYTDTDGD